PDGAYGQYNGQSVFTHGVELGIMRNETHDLQSATDELVDSLGRSNPNMGRPSGYDRVSIGNQRGLRTELSNVSDATGQRETIEIYTAQMRDGNLLYTITVAPRDQYSQYRNVFDRVIGSLDVRR